MPGNAQEQPKGMWSAGTVVGKGIMPMNAHQSVVVVKPGRREEARAMAMATIVKEDMIHINLPKEDIGSMARGRARKARGKDGTEEARESMI